LNNPLNAYKETQIKTANQGKLIIMLYDGAIKNINAALEGLKQKHHKFDEINRLIIKSQDIVTELLVSLDFEKGGEIAKNLFSLYIYINRLLLNANMKKDDNLLVEAKKILSELREAWVEIAKKGNVAQNSSSGQGGINIAG
jgi:flagellar secretion chaperone FliS